MSDEVKLPTKDELKRLSLRACVAYVARTSLRVRPFLRSDNAGHEAAVDTANQIAVNFAGSSIDEVPRDCIAVSERATRVAEYITDNADNFAVHVVEAVANGDAVIQGNAPIRADDAVRVAAARGSFDIDENSPVVRTTSIVQGAALVAATAAAAAKTVIAAVQGDAANAAFKSVSIAFEAVSKAAASVIMLAGPGNVAECRRDYEKLLELTGDVAGEMGDPIDMESLGPLWPDGEPEWFRERPGNADLLPFDQLEQLSLRAAVAYA